MTDAGLILHASYRMLMLVLLLSLPAVLASAAVGLGTAIVQAVTQIQDQSVPQALKLIVVMLTLALTSKWTAMQLYHAADQLLASVGMVGVNAH